jgi:hypothetical protein
LVTRLGALELSKWRRAKCQSEILSMERCELSKVGTGFLIGGAVALGAGIVLGVIDAFGSPTPSEGGDPPEDLPSVVFGRFSFPWGM